MCSTGREQSFFPALEKSIWTFSSKIFHNATCLSTYDFRALGFGTDRSVCQPTPEVSDLPLMICGIVHDRQAAAAALQDADVVLSGKSFLFHPDFVEAIREGRSMPRYKSEEANVAYTEEPLP